MNAVIVVSLPSDFNPKSIVSVQGNENMNAVITYSVGKLHYQV